MTRLEQSYRDNIGKLFIYDGKEWDAKERQWKKVKALVMVSEVVKNGGWFHYVSEVIRRNIDITPYQINMNSYTTPCREFHRKALPAALSQLGDTFNKGVA